MTNSHSRPSSAAGMAKKDNAHDLGEANINTKEKNVNDGVPRQPHERDEAPDDQASVPRPRIEQAARDLEQGLVDTDLYGMPGQEAVTQASKARSDMVNRIVNAGSGARADRTGRVNHDSKKFSKKDRGPG